jgi:hypothetical protein
VRTDLGHADTDPEVVRALAILKGYTTKHTQQETVFPAYDPVEMPYMGIRPDDVYLVSIRERRIVPTSYIPPHEQNRLIGESLQRPHRPAPPSTPPLTEEELKYEQDNFS